MTSYRKKYCCLPLFAALLVSASGATARAQSLDRTLAVADSLRKACLFEESVAEYEKALEQCQDSLSRIVIEDSKMLSENGAGMTDFVLHPTVVARHRFSVEEFFLYYPLKDESWRELPNVLDTTGKHPFYKAVYFPETCRSLYYSAPDSEGSMNIYRTDLKDSTWSVPCLLNEYLVSSGDEIYPMLSPDGKRLYFASSGLYGMGGFDLYVSVWNEDQHEWGPPSNMGMPYSSPYNDFLYIDTPDGKYTIFASDRDCPADSVDVYVLEQESMPVRKGIDDMTQLRRVMALDPVDDLSSFDSGRAISQIVPEDVDTREYTAKVAEVRQLKDSIYYYNVGITIFSIIGVIVCTFLLLNTFAKKSKNSKIMTKGQKTKGKLVKINGDYINGRIYYSIDVDINGTVKTIGNIANTKFVRDTCLNGGYVRNDLYYVDVYILDKDYYVDFKVIKQGKEF